MSAIVASKSATNGNFGHTLDNCTKDEWHSSTSHTSIRHTRTPVTHAHTSSHTHIRHTRTRVRHTHSI